ncbi:hypothetical protein [Bacteroides reticulotermitis]|uniref:hypothetical protein n=1 Tax=Bacteroides reticulotermitis TaxID=1133319 RepID=UPI003A89F4D4
MLPILQAHAGRKIAKTLDLSLNFLVGSADVMLKKSLVKKNERQKPLEKDKARVFKMIDVLEIIR